MQPEHKDDVNVTLIGGPMHSSVVQVDRSALRYNASIEDADRESKAVYASNGAGTAEFIFAGYSG
jgi:hypothetical protein